jgi:hypothetical protein
VIPLHQHVDHRVGENLVQAGLDTEARHIFLLPTGISLVR